MEPANIRFGGGASETILHPLVALALLAAIIVTIWLPRRRVAIIWLCTVLCVPFGQVLVLGGVHFTVYRILIIFGLLRLAFTRTLGGSRGPRNHFNPMDRALTLCAVASFSAFVLQWMETQVVIKSFGSLLDTLGGYFVLRFLIQDRDDVARIIKALAIVSFAMAICMLGEQVTRRNIFGMLGGVALEVPVREGKIRSMGSFQVYITAGVFGASLLPLFVWLSSQSKSKVTGLLGLIGATTITITSHSSTPVLAYLGGFVGLCFWPIRNNMRAFRRGLGVVLITLHVSMKAPVWALISRVDLTGSSSGFHRYMLIDQCIRHFSSWWLMGTKQYSEWGFDMWDLSNQYVAYAVTGGLLTLSAFILLISRCFARLGALRQVAKNEPKTQWFYWCLGAALMSHVVAYFGIAYFDQVQAEWYALLAMICAVSKRLPSPQSRREEPAHRWDGMGWSLQDPRAGETVERGVVKRKESSVCGAVAQEPEWIELSQS